MKSHSSAGHLHRLSIWGLLVTWLFFGSLILVEQLVPEVEATQQEQGYDPDEEALTALEHAIKPVTSLIEIGQARSSWLSENGAFLSISLYLSIGVSSTHDLRATTANRSLHQRLSTYRI